MHLLSSGLWQVFEDGEQLTAPAHWVHTSGAAKRLSYEAEEPRATAGMLAGTHPAWGPAAAPEAAHSGRRADPAFLLGQL